VVGFGFGPTYNWDTKRAQANDAGKSGAIPSKYAAIRPEWRVNG
jgi:hypothetical protein